MGTIQKSRLENLRLNHFRVITLPVDQGHLGPQGSNFSAKVLKPNIFNGNHTQMVRMTKPDTPGYYITTAGPIFPKT